LNEDPLAWGEGGIRASRIQIIIGVALIALPPAKQLASVSTA
jgi:hypothetical protein